MLIKEIFPYIKWTMIMMSYGRLFLILVSMKKLAVCKMYIYYQIVYLILEECLPRDFGEMQLKVLMNQTVLDFSLLYFNFWPSCIGVLCIQIFQVAARTFIYDKDVTSSVIAEGIGGIVFQFSNLLAMHIVINIVGLLFVKAEILRAGDEQLLNDLKEGVIIMDEESGLVLFVNKAAKKFNFN